MWPFQSAHAHFEKHAPQDPEYEWGAEVLYKMNYRGWLTIKAFPRNDPDFANSIGVWGAYSKPWDIAEKGFDFIKQMCNKHGL